MINANILLNETEYIEIKGKKFPLVQPKFIDYVKYASLDFSYKEEIHETEEQPYFENMVYLYDFFKIPKNYADIEAFNKLHFKLLNYNPEKNKKIKKNEESEENLEQIEIEDIDIVYIMSKFSSYYRYKHNEIYEMPLNLFFEMYDKIDILNAEEDLRKSDLYSLPAYMKTEKGVDIVNELEKNRKKKVMSIYKIKQKPIGNNLENFFKLRGYFENTNIGDIKS